MSCLGPGARANRRTIALMSGAIRKAVDKTIDEPPKRDRSRSARRADAEASMASLEARVAYLETELDAGRANVEETQEENAALRLQVGEMRRDMVSMRETLERLTKELKSNAMQPIHELRQELQTAANETHGLKAQVAVLQSQLVAAQAAQHEHATQLKDVAVLRAQQGFVQAAADRVDLATTEQTRLLGEVRSELAGLQQRHAALASSAVAEHGSHRSAQSQLRSSAETLALQLESVQAEMGGLRPTTPSTARRARSSRRPPSHEPLLHRLTEVQEARAGELRQPIKTLADQIKPPTTHRAATRARSRRPRHQRDGRAPPLHQQESNADAADALGSV